MFSQIVEDILTARRDGHWFYLCWWGLFPITLKGLLFHLACSAAGCVLLWFTVQAFESGRIITAWTLVVAIITLVISSVVFAYSRASD